MRWPATRVAAAKKATVKLLVAIRGIARVDDCEAAQVDV
jgi:hypothetical protein